MLKICLMDLHPRQKRKAKKAQKSWGALEKVTPAWPFLISMLDFWGVCFLLILPMGL